MQICLNMIVKNEAANLLRCFNSVLSHISSWEIVDTGSTDGTPDLIRGYFNSRGIPGRLHNIPFENFSQSRNAALGVARASSHAWDYLLLTDADMEFVVDQVDWQAELTGEAHDVLQRQGNLSYWNVRFVRRGSDALYHGVTHEYFGAASTAHVRGVWFSDHATGGSRGDKVERDIRLLSADLKENPRNDRSWFYLAQSLKDCGRHAEAIDAYTKRIELGGWDEEVWYAKRARGQVYQRVGDTGNALASALDAFNDRPWRAEPLYDLAHHFRVTGKNVLSAMFAQRGLAVPYPHNDVLFVEDHVYKHALKEELSIAGFYLDDTRMQAFLLADQLALDPDVPWETRELARTNLFHYLLPLKHHAPSFHATQLDPPVPEPYTWMNPSICEWQGDMWINLRAVNYRINEAGQYVYPPGDPFIRTRNFLFRARDGEPVRLVELIFDPPAKHGEVLGLEDVRIWPDGKDLWGSATVLQLHPGHPRQMVKFKIWIGEEQASIAELEELSPPTGCEKNWMPIDGRPGQFVYSMDSVWQPPNGRRVLAKSRFAADQFRGGGQCIPFYDGYLAIVHEAMNHQHYAQRMYAHRFVWLDYEFALQKVSLPFVFFDKQIEFAAGLASRIFVGDTGETCEIVVTFGVRDREAHMATLSHSDVRKLLR